MGREWPGRCVAPTGVLNTHDQEHDAIQLTRIYLLPWASPMIPLKHRIKPLRFLEMLLAKGIEILLANGISMGNEIGERRLWIQSLCLQLLDVSCKRTANMVHMYSIHT